MFMKIHSRMNGFNDRTNQGHFNREINYGHMQLPLSAQIIQRVIGRVIREG